MVSSASEEVATEIFKRDFNAVRGKLFFEFEAQLGFAIKRVRLEQ